MPARLAIQASRVHNAWLCLIWIVLFFRPRAKKAMRSGKARVPEFTYSAAAKALGMTNANNVAKWFNGDGLSFNTIKMILYVLNCGIEDLIEPPTKKKNKNS